MENALMKDIHRLTQEWEGAKALWGHASEHREYKIQRPDPNMTNNFNTQALSTATPVYSRI